MLHTLKAQRGMVVAPHHLAAQAGLAILREGGNAVEAMVAAASTIAVVYPHMNSIGGDGFWLIAEPGSAPYGVEGCGSAAALATTSLYKENGFDTIPARGPLAALTVAGTVSGWAKALESASKWGKALPLSRLLADAIAYAEDGVPVTDAHCDMVRQKLAELETVPGFREVFLAAGEPKSGSVLKNKALGAMLRRLASAGLDDFYRGDVARSMAADLERVGSPLRLADVEAHEALMVKPLSVDVTAGTIFNLPPPTQGLASLLILALYDQMAADKPDGFDHVHRIVECTKAAFKVRDVAAIDPRNASTPASSYLAAAFISEQSKTIDKVRALGAPRPTPDLGDTIWMGAIDGEGRAVSFIQSTYWEFGSGVVLPGTGVNWQNRGQASRSILPRPTSSCQAANRSTR